MSVPASDISEAEVNRQLWEISRATAELNRKLGKFYGDRIIAENEQFRSDIKRLISK